MPNSSTNIELRGVRVHNLKNIDVDIPLGRITVVTGVSGSGKSSLAFDTLYAEGQRRYIESFSAYARRFLDRLDKPDSDRIDHLPPAIALRQNEARRRRRDSIAAVTEIDNYLRLLFSRLGQVVCPSCGQRVKRSSAADVVAFLNAAPRVGRGVIGFPVSSATAPEVIAGWQRLGLSRALVVKDDEATFATLAEVSAVDVVAGRVLVVVDRVSLDKTTSERLTESAEAALREGQGRCVVLLEVADKSSWVRTLQIDDRAFARHDFSTGLSCLLCKIEYIEPEPSLFNQRSPLGACPSCHGDGRTIFATQERLVPDSKKSLEHDAFALLTDARWRHERRRLMEFAERSKISLKKAFQKLSDGEQFKLLNGDPDSDFDGLRGFLRRLKRRDHLPSIARYLGQWCDVIDCSTCAGTGLREEARAVQLPRDAAVEAAQRFSLSDLLSDPIQSVLEQLRAWSEQLVDEHKVVAKHLIPELLARLEQLVDLGLGYLSLGRTLDSLAHGEAQRVALSSVLASRLVNTLFVLDEPSAGLHPRDFAPVIRGIQRLKSAGNTVVVIEHEADFIAIADQHLTIGPGAGSNGGTVVSAALQTPLAPLGRGRGGEGQQRTGPDCNRPSPPAPLPRGARGEVVATSSLKHASRVSDSTRWIDLRNVRHHNLNGVNARFPLGCLCVISGVSGAGKTSLLEGVLWPALCRALKQSCSVTPVGQYDELLGANAIEQALLVDDSPLVGGSRSNPATWLKAFDEIRKLFAESAEAKNRLLSPAYFSFNNEAGGRCPKCEGTGSVAIDMQFLADVVMHCPECNGRRFTREALEITWRNLSIADVLALTASDAFVFFKGHRRLQRRLKSLKDVGLGYLTLGQPLNTLSGGEAQRLKLAATLARSQRRTLVLMNEPTTGLHPQDVEHLLKCFHDLLEVGQSLIIVENDPMVLAAADFVIELGPGAGPDGGRLIRG